MRKKAVSLLLALALGMSLAVPALAADADWAAEAVNALNQVYDSGVFSADDTPMTEGDAYAILKKIGVSTAGLNQNSEIALTRNVACKALGAMFKLPVGNDAVSYLYDRNFVYSLNPDTSVSNADFSVLAYRLLNATGGGKGSGNTALKPGTEEYFAWMYLAARPCAPFKIVQDGVELTRTVLDTPIKDATIYTHYVNDVGIPKQGEEIWNTWYSDLSELNKENGLAPFEIPTYDETETVSAAAIRMVAAADPNATGIFYDVPASHWAYDGVMYLYDREIMLGNGLGEFVNGEELQRAQFAILLSRIFTKQITDEEKAYTFHLIDVPEMPIWVYNNDSIKAVVSRGYMTADETEYGNWANWWEGKFTREEAVVGILKLCAAEYDVTIDPGTINLSILDRFKDAADISDAAKPYMAYAVSIGLINGDGNDNLNPSQNSTREEIGVLLYRTLIGLDTSKMHDYNENVRTALGGQQGG